MNIARSLLFLGITCSACFAEPNTNDVPPEIAGVSLGMHWRAFLALGRDVEVLNAMPDKTTVVAPDPDHPQRSLTEKLENGPFDRVIYGFENGTLTSIMIGGEVKEKRANRAGVLRQVLVQYGAPDSIGIMRDQKSHGLLKWHGNHTQIRAILPTKDETGFVCVQILSDSVAEQIENAEKAQSPPFHSGEEGESNTLMSVLRAEVSVVLDETAKTRLLPQK
ncbi:MAG: hypothetical protein PHR35_03005 [Kiritimatiellae bacterium]|nr:hypothetical protein [Kiritimatiellia bacterium]